MKKYILFLILFQSLNSAYAQVDRSIAPSQYKNNTSQKVVKKDPVEITLKYLKEQLSLDSFQEAAIKVYLIENQTNAEKINSSDISNNEKKAKFNEELKKFDVKIIEILNPEQIKIFEELKEKNKSKGKKKKKKEEEN